MNFVRWGGIQSSAFHKPALYQGTTSVVPKRATKTRGFNPCGTWLPDTQSIYETPCGEVALHSSQPGEARPRYQA
jgi:hypothetical protein